MDDFQAFLTIAQERSFTKAAKKLKVTPSALSHAMKALEERLGIRLLARTTRNVGVTEAGEKLANSIGPLYDQINIEINKLNELRDQPAGTIRITGSDDAIRYFIQPKLPKFLINYPDINIEISNNYAFNDIIDDRFDAGIRLGEAINKDMIVTRISPDWRLSVVGSPLYFKKHPSPTHPKDLADHNCINIRHSPNGGLYVWEFEKEGVAINIKVHGQYTANSNYSILDATLSGIGIAYLPNFLVEPYLQRKELIEVMSDWSPYFSGFYLYYPNRRQSSTAFKAFINEMRYKE